MPDHPHRFIIVGGGASGALMAAHLLRDNRADISVAIVEKRAQLGRGLAYATANPSHLLNVRAANMSAFADDPDHFWRWLVAQGEAKESDDRFRFVPRGVYGRYLEGLLLQHPPGRPGAAGLTVIQDRACGVRETPGGVEIALQGGRAIQADVSILACGHENVMDDSPFHVSPWAEPIGGSAPTDATLLILGTGLTMVDASAALHESGHRGRIVALSRRGLLPQAHRDVEALKIDAGAAPFDRDIATICHWLRELARQTQAQGGDWRSVIDGLRPHTQTIWRNMPQRMRRRFLEHARPWWDVHRHRMAPEVAVRMKALINRGQVEIIAGKIVAIDPDGDGARVTIRRRGAREIENLQVSRIISCTGVTSVPRTNAAPLVESLFARGLARTDPLRIGVDVDANCAIVDQEGRASRRLFAIGPMSQAAFWEITAVPDIRLQTAQLARHLKEPGVGAASGLPRIDENCS